MHAVRSLTRLEATECLKIVQRQHEIIERLKDAKRLTALWDIPKYLTEEEIEEISGKLDEEYWDNKDNIIEKTFKHYADIYGNL